jgi:uncharacterized SAM-binding protein YcdF (DUF218 family)
MRKGYESITDFIFVNDPIEKADVILIPGGSHLELINKAVELYKQGYANYILPSGGFNKKIPDYESEYEFLREEAIKQGIPDRVILKENKAAHTFDNAQFSYEVCLRNNIEMKKVILVCKNFHSRRAYITYKLNFPRETQIIVQSIVDGNGITRDNWIESDTKRKVVMGEVLKIGKYFSDHIESLG